MPSFTMAEIRSIAEGLGHRDLRVVEMGADSGWWRAECACGYRSARRSSQTMGAEAAVHHMVTEARRWGNAAAAAGRSATPMQHAS
jgi:hypothetical protein